MSARIATEKKIVFDLLVSYGAILWALLFALLHFVWAAGFYIFLPENLASQAFGQKWFLIYDITAGFLCVTGAVSIILLAHSSESRRFHSVVKIVVFIGTIILVLRAAAGIGKFFYLLLQKQSLSEALAYWDLWFCLGAGLFAASLRQITRRGKF